MLELFCMFSSNVLRRTMMDYRLFLTSTAETDRRFVDDLPEAMIPNKAKHAFWLSGCVGFVRCSSFESRRRMPDRMPSLPQPVPVYAINADQLDFGVFGRVHLRVHSKNLTINDIHRD